MGNMEGFRAIVKPRSIATEAAAFGVVGAMVLAALQGSLAGRTFIDSLMGAVCTSCMVALILAGAAFLSLPMGFTGLPESRNKPE